MDEFFRNAPNWWSVVSASVAGLSGWLLAVWRVQAGVEQTRLKMISDSASSEAIERAAFRTELIAEVAALRRDVKACETEKEDFRHRMSQTESRILVLQATNEITERWLAFFKDRSSSVPVPQPLTSTSVLTPDVPGARSASVDVVAIIPV